MVLGAVVYGSLAARWPWTGGDYAWQTRILDARLGAVLALTSWWLVVAATAPVFGNLVLVQVVDPLLTEAGWDGLASWFRERDGIFACSLIAIAVATAFVGLGMRRAAWVQRALVAIGGASFLTVVVLLLTANPAEFARSFDEQSAEIYGTGQIASSQIVQIENIDPEVTELEPASTVRLVPLLLLFALWIGWAGPLVGEVRAKTRDACRLALVRVAMISTLVALVFLVAIGRGQTWELWNEANDLYWRTIYGTAATTPLPAWPNPVVFATWVTDSTAIRILVMAGMAAWVVGLAATLFLAATRVLLAAASDGVLPRFVARTTGDSVPTAALALLVLPACAFSALGAYSDSFTSWASVAVVALAVTTLGTAFAAANAFRREDRKLAVVAVLFFLVVTIAVGAWIADPVYGIRTVGSLLFLVSLYSIAGLVLVIGRRRGSGAVALGRSGATVGRGD